MDCEPLLCSVCRGQRYPRQCRNSWHWRQGRDVPAVCPFGLPLNGLPIGDNAPAQRRTGPLPGKRRVDCAHADRLSCCRIRCTHREGKGLVLVNAHCCAEKCRYYQTRAEEEATAAHV